MNSEIVLPVRIIYEQAPCQPDGEIISDGEGESKEGACYCSQNPGGCCINGLGMILPKRLKADVTEEEIAAYNRFYGIQN